MSKAPGVMLFYCRDHSFSRRFVGRALKLEALVAHGQDLAILKELTAW
jgi:hypothetical protein